MKKLLTCLTVILFIFGLTINTNAQGFVIQPISIELDLSPGESHQQELIIKNTSGEAKTFNIAMSDWLMDQNGTPEYLPGGSIKNSCANWVTLGESLVELAPNQTKKVNITIKVPSGGSDATWAAILVSAAEEQLPPENADQDVVMGGQAVVRIGVPVFQAPSTNDSWKATISDLKEGGIDPQNNRTVYQATIQNQGGRVIKGNIYTTLSNVQTGEETQLEPFEAIVLPGLKRDIKFQLPPNVAKGQYTLTVILDYSDEMDYEGTQTEVTIN